MKNWIIISFVFLLIGCSTKVGIREFNSPLEKLQYEIAQQFEDSNFVNAHWGVLIKSLKTGETLYSRNENKMFMPASNMKLVTTSTALALLGSDFRYTTKLVTSGEIKNGILNGDLFLIGSGDPSISGKFTDSIPTKVFEQWADSLRAKGIFKINGNIIGDDNCFDEEYYGSGWEADDESYYYGAQISGISFNDNCVDLTVVADAISGKQCTVSCSPKTNYVTIINQTQTVQKDSTARISIFRKRGTNTVFAKGSMEVSGKPYIESIAIDNPTLFVLTVMKEVFELKGISISGRVVDIDDDSLKIISSKKQIAERISPTISELSKEINKQSNNLYTEQLFRTIGAQKTGVGSMESGKFITYPLLASWGVDTIRLRVNDGSGLSRHNLITPTDLVSILTGMYKNSSYKYFYESLPIAGIDGTIKNRMRGTLAENNVHAKTGSVEFVRSLSGYVTSKDGEMFVFSMIVNHYTVPTKLAEKIQDAVCVKLAEFKRN